MEADVASAMEEAERAQDSAPKYRPRPRRTAAERRAQAQRAQRRVVQSLLRGFQELGSHRGCQPTYLGAARATLLKISPDLTEGRKRTDMSSQTLYVEPSVEAAAQTEEYCVHAVHTEN